MKTTSGDLVSSEHIQIRGTIVSIHNAIYTDGTFNNVG